MVYCSTMPSTDKERGEEPLTDQTTRATVQSPRSTRRDPTRDTGYAPLNDHKMNTFERENVMDWTRILRRMGDAARANGARGNVVPEMRLSRKNEALEKAAKPKHSKKMPAQELEADMAQIGAKSAQLETNVLSASNIKLECLKIATADAYESEIEAMNGSINAEDLGAQIQNGVLKGVNAEAETNSQIDTHEIVKHKQRKSISKEPAVPDKGDDHAFVMDMIIACCATHNADGAYELYTVEADNENLCVDAYDMINTDDAEANGDRKTDARKGRIRDAHKAVAADSEVEEGEVEHQLYCATNACNNDSNAVDAVLEAPQSFIDDIAAQQRFIAMGNDNADDIALDICAVCTNDSIASEELMAHEGRPKYRPTKVCREIEAEVDLLLDASLSNDLEVLASPNGIKDGDTREHERHKMDASLAVERENAMD